MTHPERFYVYRVGCESVLCKGSAVTVIDAMGIVRGAPPEEWRIYPDSAWFVADGDYEYVINRDPNMRTVPVRPTGTYAAAVGEGLRPDTTTPST